MSVILIVLLVLILAGGGWGYRSGMLPTSEPLGLILVIVLFLLVTGMLTGPLLGWYHW